MFLQSDHDLVILLGVAAFILLALSILGGVIASLKSFQVRQFQDLLFKAERKIDTLERRMFNVLNAVPVALVETDATGKFTFANRAAHQLLGRKDTELLGLRFHSATWGITYPDGRMIPPDLLPIARTLRGQTVKGFQHLMTRYGTQGKVLVSATSMPVMNNIGEVIGSSAALVELETAHGEGIDDLNGLWRGHWFEAATVPFWGLDASGRIVDVNAAACEAFSLTRDQILSDNWAQAFVNEADFQAAMTYLAQIGDENAPHPDVSIHLRVRSPRGGDETLAQVTAWRVRTHEGGEHGLTVMALPAETAVPAATPSLAAPVTGISEQDHEVALERVRAKALAEAQTLSLALADSEARHQQALDTLKAEHADALAAIQIPQPDDTAVEARHNDAIEALKVAHAETLAQAVSDAKAEGHSQGLADGRAEADAAQVEHVYGWYDGPTPVTPEPVVVREADPAVTAENAELKTRLAALEHDLDDMRTTRNDLQVQVNSLIAAQSVKLAPEPDPRLPELEAELAAARTETETLHHRVAELESAPAPMVDTSAHEARIKTLEADLAESRSLLVALEKHYVARVQSATQAPESLSQADAGDWEEKLSAAEAHAAALQTQVDAAQARLDQASEALSQAQKYETVGRLTHSMAQDFAQMLSVINGALEVLARESNSPENLRRLSEAALAASRRGERLTRQLQAFQSEEF